MPRRSDFLLYYTPAQIARKAALDVLQVFVGIAVLVVLGTSILLPFLPIGGR